MIGFRDGVCRARRHGKSMGALLIVVSTLGGPSASAQETLAALQYNGIIIENVTLIDGTGRPPVAGVSVLVRGDRIVAIGPGPLAMTMEYPGPRTIDGTGKYLMPGLWDVHVHLSGGRGRRGPDFEAGIRALHGFIYSGITAIFDAGNRADFIFGLRAREREGEIVSPRIFATGPVVTAPGGHGGGRGATLIDSWPEAIEALDAHIELQPDMVKFTFDEHGWGTRPLIPLLDVDLMARAGRYFNEHGIRTTVHISHEYRAIQAIEAGIDTLAHPIIQGPVSDEFVALMASKKVPMVSTLTIGEGYSRLVEHPEFLDRPLYQAVYEPETIERLRTAMRDQYAARAWTTWMKVMTPVAQENLRKISAAGGVIVLGSDQSAGPQSHRELELMVEGGIPALEAIRIGTLNAAIFMDKERDLGSIEVGKLADMVLLSADPLADISNAQQIDTVIKGGRIIDRAALDLPVNRRR
ncbi:MAG: amidohydrolase family protein [Acidobacteria bacterium]|nr:amidohydrolase family protein [Acidobacteriota bacterium]